ncbi:MAG: PQQ-dependent sugar dehydrogenase, partial [Blastococcus sp.]|nr:PQQ-dependent sugar dehydrogenase [Blastococcus sp.]
MRRAPLVLAVLLAATATGCGASADERFPELDGPAPSGAPELQVEVVTDGLQNPWDVVQAPDGTLLLDERAGGFTAVLPDGTVREVEADFDDLFAEGETGLMGLALDPSFETDRRLYSCQGDRGGSIQV